MGAEMTVPEWESKFRRRLESSPQDVSLDYAVSLTITLFQFRDLVKELPEEFQGVLVQLDESYNDLVTEASKAFYRMGFVDGLSHQQSTNEGDR